MKPALFLLLLTSLISIQSVSTEDKTQLTKDISIVFPCAVISNSIGADNLMFFTVNDSFHISAAVSAMGEPVSADSVKQIAGHDANVFEYYRAFKGKGLKSSRSKVNSADRIDFTFQSVDEDLNGSSGTSDHKGLVLYHKQNLILIDFIISADGKGSPEKKLRLETIRTEFYKSLEVK